MTSQTPLPGPSVGTLVDLGVSTLGAAGAHLLPDRIRQVTGGPVAGPAFTVTCHEGDNLALHAAVAAAPPGSVLVATTDGAPDRGYWGEVLTVAAQSRGIAGIVIDAGVRDIDALRALGFPCYGRLVAARGTAKRQGGSLRAPLTLGTAPVATGDWVVADLDGVAVLPAASAGAIQSRARARQADERSWIGRIRAGELTTDILELDLTTVAGS